MRVMGVHHVAIPVSDLERAEQFCRDVLSIARATVPSDNPKAVVI